MSGEGKKIIIGYPLDSLLNRNSSLSEFENDLNSKRDEIGGIVLPDEKDLGTGNIVIRGRPGTCKSTLAIQMAVSCTLNPNNYDVIYLSLEERPENVKQKASSFGWGDIIQTLRQLNSLDHFSTPYELGKTIALIFSQDENNCPLCFDKIVDLNNLHYHQNENKEQHHVLVPSLSPRSLSFHEQENGQLFWNRYQQLEKLLSGAKYLRENKEKIQKELNQIYIPDIRVVCIDSLNVFADKLLNREELFRIFDLLKKYETIGIFIVEEDEKEILSPDSRIHGDMIEYLADVVISLSSDEDNDYYMRYFEIIKSRNQHQIYGRHPFKIKNAAKDHKNNNDNFEMLNMFISNRSGVIIYPSLHYIVLITEQVKD
jgi:KaiC/GvpD/RAD55 family RecA-like ATPase